MRVLLFAYILILMSSTGLSQHPPLGEPSLHGLYTPHGHKGRSLTFYNNGEFYSQGKDSAGIEIKGFGTWERKEERLILNFHPLTLHPKIHQYQEKAHVEIFIFKQAKTEEMEIQGFTLTSTHRKDQGFAYLRSSQHIDYRLRGE